jgi:tetratricopeptide (TPR) repeat protein
VPTISAVSPEAVPASGRSSEVVVRGSGFTKPLSVTLSWANGAASKQLGAYQVRVHNDEQLTLLFNPGTRDDNWAVQVSNANGESSAVYPFRVVSSAGVSEKAALPETVATAEAGQETAVVKKLLAQRPADRALSIYRKASAQLSRGEVTEGEAGLHRALELKADLHAARELLAGLLLRQKRVSEAAQVLDEGLALSPGTITFIVLRARIYTEQANLPKAISLLESQQPVFENAGDYYGLLAALYQRNGRHDAAADLYRRMLQRSPGQAVWHMGLGISLEALGNKVGAREAYQRALQSGLRGNDVRNFVNARLRILQ